MIEKVISGGQTGADQAGLKAARTAGIPTGGFIPRGYKTLDGPAPWLGEEFNLVEIESDSYSERTRLNVMQSDCTLRFAFDFSTPGERCTLKHIKYYVKPYRDFGVNVNGGGVTLTIQDTHDLVDWLRENNFKIINIAGNAERRHRGIGDAVYKFLVPVFERLEFEAGQIEEHYDYFIRGKF